MPTINPTMPRLPVKNESPNLSPRLGPEPELGVGDHLENAVFSGLDSVFSGLSSLGLVRPTVEAGLKLVAGGQEDAWYHAMADHAGTMLEAEYEERGSRKSYEERVAEYLKEAKAGGRFVRGLNEKTAFHNPQFVRELEEVGDAKFVGGNHIEFLHDGPASFAKRAELIDRAQESIHLLTWTIYDDGTGKDLAKRLARRAQDGLDVRVIVDRNIAARGEHIETLQLMEDSGVKLIRWENPDHVQWGNHCKMMVADGVHSVAGGRNLVIFTATPGVWTIMRSEWRDTDVFNDHPQSIKRLCLFVIEQPSRAAKLKHAPISMNGELLSRAEDPVSPRLP